VAALVVFTLAARARAQVAPEPEQSARHTAAPADRVLLVPTAETHPQGTVFASDYDILVLALGYAVTDRVQVSLTGTTDGHGGFADLDLKANLLRSRFVRLAALTSIDFVHTRQGEDVLFGRAGASGQLCFDLECATSFTLHAMIVAHDQPDTLLPVGLGAGFIARAGRDVSLLLEYDMLVNASRDLDFIDLPVYAVAYGVRIRAASARATVDVAFLRRMQSDTSVRLQPPALFDLLGVPLLAFTYRWLP